MNASVFWALVRKDLYLMRGFIITTIVVGLVSLALIALGGVGFAVGGILFLTANVASGIFIAMFSYLAERKDHSRMFALSLPISGPRYDMAKLVGVFASYGIPWLVLTIAGVVFFLLPPAATKGMIVYALMLQVFVLALFSVTVAALSVSQSETASGLVILGTNILFSLFMVTLNQPRISSPLRSPQIVWTGVSVWTLAAEAAAIVAGIAIALSMIARKRDHI